MTQFKIGDKVKVVAVCEPEDKDVIGRVGEITTIHESETYPYYVSNMPTSSWHFAGSQLKLLKKQGDNKVAKFYKVIKDTPVWEVGAILSQENDDDGYCAINDLFVKEIKDVDNDYTELEAVVENQDEFFERVYPVSHLKKTLYLSKVKAREAHEELYKEKK